MTGRVFVDTNVLLYSFDSRDTKKQAAADRWRKLLWHTHKGRTSFQVLSEFYVNIIRRWPEQRDEARAVVKDLFSWEPIAVDAALLELSWTLQDRYRFSHWDALIVAAALAARCDYLLTEDLQHNQEMQGVRVISPFAQPPEAILPLS